MDNISEIEKAVLQEIDNIAMKQVVHSQPLYTFEDILLSKTITKLRELGRIHKIARILKWIKTSLSAVLLKKFQT